MTFLLARWAKCYRTTPPSHHTTCISRHTTEYRGNRFYLRAIFILFLRAACFSLVGQRRGVVMAAGSRSEIAQSLTLRTELYSACLLCCLQCTEVAQLQRGGETGGIYRVPLQFIRRNRHHIQTMVSRCLPWTSGQRALDNAWPGPVSWTSVQQQEPALKEPASERACWALSQYKHHCSDSLFVESLQRPLSLLWPR